MSEKSFPFVGRGAFYPFFFALLTTVSAQTASPTRVSPSNASIEAGRIDELVFGKLKSLGISPSERCSDEVFFRRVYLDVIGTLPLPQDARAFLASKDPNKRSALIDELLERDEFADYWSMKWSELLRVKAEFPSNLWPRGVQVYHEWIKTALKQNMPYDRFARELLTASGSNFHVPAVNFYRVFSPKDPLKTLEGVALIFMGTRTKNWSEEQRLGMAAFFARLGRKETGEWKEEILYFDPDEKWLNPATGKPPVPVLLDGKTVVLSPGEDPRVAFADWLTAPDNPWFARNIVNRVWSWLMGRGIIHEADDIRPDNPPQNPELLAWLEKDLVSHQFDLKHIYRIILNSRAYQLSAEPTAENRSDLSNFSHHPVRRLEAEVLIDALCRITGTTETYSSQIPEPFTFIPEDQRAIALADGSTTSPFLELFGRSPRDTGYESERNNDPSVTQRLHLLNSTHIQNKIQRGPALRKLFNENSDDPGKIRALYLAILSRFPTPEEEKTAGAYLQSGKSGKMEAAGDLAWALINTKEFLYRH